MMQAMPAWCIEKRTQRARDSWHKSATVSVGFEGLEEEEVCIGHEALVGLGLVLRQVKVEMEHSCATLWRAVFVVSHGYPAMCSWVKYHGGSDSYLTWGVP